MSPAGWSNWSGRISCPDARIEAPADVDALVTEARDDGGALRPLGSGHSFVPFWQPGDTLLDLGAFSGLLGVDAEAGRATFGAATPLHMLGELLEPAGLALANMGDIDRQTLAGALATGTHGTGIELGNLSSRITRLELVDGQGRQIVIEEGDDLRAARVSLGLLGVFTRVTLALQPAYWLHERNRVLAPEACVESLAEQVAAHRHFEFWWVPRTDSRRWISAWRASAGAPATRCSLRPVI